MKISHIISLIAIVICCSCEEKKSKHMPIPMVAATKIVRKNIPMSLEAPAKITGSLEIQIRAQVNGILKARLFQEGQYVKQNEKLFEIDPAQYNAALTRAQGTLAQTESELRRTKRDYARMKKLHKEGAISQKEHDDSLSAFERASANIKVAEGSLHEAQINLGYTVVRAPISGIARKENQSVGNLISATNESSLLTSMVQICPLHANFSVSGTIWSGIAKKHVNGELKLLKFDDYKVQVILADGSFYQQIGKIIFVDSNVDNLTSSVSIKAEIPNNEQQKVLLPGQFVRVKLIGAEYENALIVPVSALISVPDGFIVYTINADKKVESHSVTAELVNNDAIITSGLEEGDLVITEGIIKVRNGSTVDFVIKNQTIS